MKKSEDVFGREYISPELLPSSFDDEHSQQQIERAVARINEIFKRKTKSRRENDSSNKWIKLIHSKEGMKIRFEAVSGFISLGRLHVYIAPKLHPKEDHDWSVLLNKMLEIGGERASRAIHVFPEALNTELLKEGMFEPIARHYADSLLAALDEQPLMSYRRLREDRPFLKGRLRVHKQITRAPHQQHRFACEYSRFTLENPCTDLLRWANHYFLRFSKFSATQKRLTMAIERMGRFTRTPSNHSVENLRIPISAEPYRVPLELARSLFESTNKSGKTGKSSTAGILIRMNDFFEAYISGLYRLWVIKNSGYTLDRQAEHRLAQSDWNHYPRNSSRIHHTRSDDILRKDGQIILISDTKYKGNQDESSNERLSSSDLYQLISTCISTQTNSALVIRPAIGEKRIDNPLEIWTIDNPILLNSELTEEIEEALTQGGEASLQEILNKIKQQSQQKIRVGVLYLNCQHPKQEGWITQQLSQLGNAIEKMLAPKPS